MKATARHQHARAKNTVSGGLVQQPLRLNRESTARHSAPSLTSRQLPVLLVLLLFESKLARNARAGEDECVRAGDDAAEAQQEWRSPNSSTTTHLKAILLLKQLAMVGYALLLPGTAVVVLNRSSSCESAMESVISVSHQLHAPREKIWNQNKCVFSTKMTTLTAFKEPANHTPRLPKNRYKFLHKSTEKRFFVFRCFPFSENHDEPHQHQSAEQTHSYRRS